MSGGHDFDPATVAELSRRAKVALRQRARGVRASIPLSGAAERSRAIVERLKTLEPLLGARSIALFDAMAAKREVDVRSLDGWARERGASVVYPSMDRAAWAMTFRDPGDPDAMQDRGFGFREPDPSAPEATEIDVIVTPALLVDGRGIRLGYGGGFYDRALAQHKPRSRAVCVVYEFQLAADLPRAEHDVPVDLVVTDERVLAIADS
jgi:5-formyltetrahydrofolate cyclo-ligase